MRLTRNILILTALLILCGCATTAPFAAYKNKTAEQIYTEGESALAKGKYETASKSFEALDALYPFGPYSEQAQLDIIYAYYKNDDSVGALAAADRYIRLYPRNPNVDYAYYMKGLINFGRDHSWTKHFFHTNPANRDLSYLSESFNDFGELIETFPQSQYAPDARQRMIYIRNVMAQHSINVAEFYFERKAYVAAANRASDVVENFQGTPQVKTALVMMVKAYRALGEMDMANNALHVLELNYPNAKEVRRLERGQLPHH